MSRKNSGLRFGLLPGLFLLLITFFGIAPVASAGEEEGIQAEAPADFAAAEAEASIIAHALEPWIGDLDGMVERGMIRIAIPYGVMTYFLDRGEQRGLTYDAAQQFEIYLRDNVDEGIAIVAIPARRNEIFQMLVDGRADIAAGTLTVTEERAAIVDFSDPLYTKVREVIVTGPAAPAGSTLDDLAGLEIYVRPSSSFFEHLTALNAERGAAGLPVFSIKEADENLRTEDLIEMVNAGLIPATIADEPIADFLAQIFENVVVHKDAALGGEYDMAWAFRQNSPQLAEALNAFIETARKGTMLGNVILNKYLKTTDWAVDELALRERARLQNLIDLFNQYGEQYGFDWIMVAAQGYQESHLDQSKLSPVGAIGIMQVMPTTAADPNVGIPDISTEEANIHAGIKYLRFLQDRYFDDPALSDLDRMLFSFGAYNAGPGNVNKARNLAEEMGLDRNVWFDNVEIAIGKAVSREPVTYVRNIYKYYVAFRLITELEGRVEQ
jgi:membrane-bound lytic murein transglycosylase MltF